MGIVAAVAALIAVLLLPPAAGLPPAGQIMLAILAFAVIVWMTEALDYSVSAVVIAALVIFLLAGVPDPAKTAGHGDGHRRRARRSRCRASPTARSRWSRRPASSPRR